ncbi:Ribosome-associated ATPase [Anaerolineae bacterium]|nr:Ribosome-associated ATPase [Anaerolineae bacterium]
MEYAVECRDLTHYYGKRLIFENMNFNVRRGSIFGLLGKNGTGKTTTINILNGFLTPTGGQCLVFGEDSRALTPATKARMGFLIEGHVQYAFMTIRQIEKFYSAFFPRWNKAPYYELMAKLEVTESQKLSTMSCGQRSQVALGLILAQDPDLMVLDDYSMGLDAGYRRLFIDYLQEYARAEGKTIFITSHIIQDLDGLIDDCVIIDYRSVLVTMPIRQFQSEFKRFTFTSSVADLKLPKDDVVKNTECIKHHATLYSFKPRQDVEAYLRGRNIGFEGLKEVPMSLEDAFIGITGKY